MKVYPNESSSDDNIVYIPHNQIRKDKHEGEEDELYDHRSCFGVCVKCWVVTIILIAILGLLALLINIGVYFGW